MNPDTGPDQVYQPFIPLLANLPPIAYEVARGAIWKQYRKPYIHGGYICATDGVLAVEFNVLGFDPELIKRLPHRVKGSNLPNVDRQFLRWEGDGRSWLMPGFDDDIDRSKDRSKILIGGTAVLAHRLLFLARYGVRRLYTGRNPMTPLRFDIGDVGEGLLMPTRLTCEV